MYRQALGPEFRPGRRGGPPVIPLPETPRIGPHLPPIAGSHNDFYDGLQVRKGERNVRPPPDPDHPEISDPPGLRAPRNQVEAYVYQCSGHYHPKIKDFAQPVGSNLTKKPRGVAALSEDDWRLPPAGTEVNSPIQLWGVNQMQAGLCYITLGNPSQEAQDRAKAVLTQGQRMMTATGRTPHEVIARIPPLVAVSTGPRGTIYNFVPGREDWVYALQELGEHKGRKWELLGVADKRFGTMWMLQSGMAETCVMRVPHPNPDYRKGGERSGGQSGRQRNSMMQDFFTFGRSNRN